MSHHMSDPIDIGVGIIQTGRIDDNSYPYHIERGHELSYSLDRFHREADLTPRDCIDLEFIQAYWMYRGWSLEHGHERFLPPGFGPDEELPWEVLQSLGYLGAADFRARFLNECQKDEEARFRDYYTGEDEDKYYAVRNEEAFQPVRRALTTWGTEDWSYSTYQQAFNRYQSGERDVWARVAPHLFNFGMMSGVALDALELASIIGWFDPTNRLAQRAYTAGERVVNALSSGVGGAVSHVASRIRGSSLVTNRFTVAGAQLLRRADNWLDRQIELDRRRRIRDLQLWAKYDLTGLQRDLPVDLHKHDLRGVRYGYESVEHGVITFIIPNAYAPYNVSNPVRIRYGGVPGRAGQTRFYGVSALSGEVYWSVKPHSSTGGRIRLSTQSFTQDGRISVGLQKIAAGLEEGQRRAVADIASGDLRRWRATQYTYKANRAMLGLYDAADQRAANARLRQDAQLRAFGSGGAYTSLLRTYDRVARSPYARTRPRQTVGTRMVGTAGISSPAAILKNVSRFHNREVINVKKVTASVPTVFQAIQASNPVSKVVIRSISKGITAHPHLEGAYGMIPGWLPKLATAPVTFQGGEQFFAAPRRASSARYSQETDSSAPPYGSDAYYRWLERQ